MEHCDLCGKLIQIGEGRCRACRREAELSSDAKSSPKSEPREAVPAPEPDDADDPYQDELCVRCRKHYAIKESDFCLACQLELLSMLGGAAHELFQEAPPPPKPPIASPASLMSDLDAKRERTATSRINVVGGVKIK